MAEPVLTLDTLVERRTVVINGTPYEMTSPEELSLLDYHRIQRRSARIAELLERVADLSEEEIIELLGKLDDFVRQVLDVPEDVRSKLSENQKIKILTAFTVLHREAASPTGATESPTAENQ